MQATLAANSSLVGLGFFAQTNLQTTYFDASYGHIGLNRSASSGALRIASLSLIFAQKRAIWRGFILPSGPQQFQAVLGIAALPINAS